MASERQIKANRRNARHSTGPKTGAGRLASASNARRHGLSVPMKVDEAQVAALRGLASVLASGEGLEANWLLARMAAGGHLEVMRVRHARFAAILELVGRTKSCHREYGLAGFDRYERFAFNKRRKGIAQLLKPK